MRTFDQWMSEYEVSHRNPVNKKIHMVCVPVILFTVIGFLWCIPRPAFFGENPFINWATITCATWLIFYLTLNFKMFLGMLVQMLVMFVITQKIYETGILLPLSAIVFVIAWIGQFYGHKIEGKKPSFINDIFFLLIGPLWVTRYLYNRIGITV